MSWVSVCSTCGKGDDCACELTPYVREQRRRLDEGMKRADEMPPETVEALHAMALQKATVPGGVVGDRAFYPPSLTDWQIDVERDRWRD